MKHVEKNLNFVQNKRSKTKRFQDEKCLKLKLRLNISLFLGTHLCLFQLLFIDFVHQNTIADGFKLISTNLFGGNTIRLEANLEDILPFIFI